MTALLMLAAIVGGTAVAFGAGAVERALRLWHRPARGAWAAALALTLLLPVAAPATARLAAAALASRASTTPDVARSTPDGMRILPAIVVRASGASDRALQRARAALGRADRPLIALWLATSALALLALVRGVLTLRRAARGWSSEVVDGVRVDVAHDVGPAVLGVTRPRIVLPTWALALERPLRALVLRHELEHARAGDPALLLAGALLVTAMPWNPAAWWIARRLRAAIEIDCDARVLRAHPDVTRYGLLLLAVAQRRDQARASVPALAALSALAPAPTDLERRIATMRARPIGGRARLARTLALGTGAAAATVTALLACAAPDMVAAKPRDAAADARTARPDSMAIPPVVPVSPLGTAAPMPNAVDPDLARIQFSLPGDGNLSPGEAYHEFQVEEPARPVSGSGGPRYPAEARRLGLEGEVLVQFVVDTAGRVVGPVRLLRSTGSHLFADAVIDALTTMRFEPARIGGQKVRQLVQQPFQFALSKR